MQRKVSCLTIVFGVTISTIKPHSNSPISISTSFNMCYDAQESQPQMSTNPMKILIRLITPSSSIIPVTSYTSYNLEDGSVDHLLNAHLKQWFPRPNWKYVRGADGTVSSVINITTGKEIVPFDITFPTR